MSTSRLSSALGIGLVNQAFASPLRGALAVVVGLVVLVYLLRHLLAQLVRLRAELTAAVRRQVPP